MDECFIKPLAFIYQSTVTQPAHNLQVLVDYVTTYLEFVLTLEAVQQVLEVGVTHLAKEGQEAGHILPLPIVRQEPRNQSIRREHPTISNMI